MLITVIDYGAGNLRSVQRALEEAGRRSALSVDVQLTHEPDLIAAADRIVLPGQGAFKDCMEGLAGRPGVIEAMSDAVLSRGRPFLGICVGLQLLAERGLEHGETAGLGWLGGVCRGLTGANGARLPHMGWNEVRPVAAHPVLDVLLPAHHMYYAHSFVIDPAAKAHVLAETTHGEPFAAAAGRDTIVGVQFHPEKSQAAGIALLSAFLAWRP